MDTSISEYAQKLVLAGHERHASDLYVLPWQNQLAIYLRVASTRQLYGYLSASDGANLIRHFKFLAHMDIAEVRKPQMGAFSYPLGREVVRLRMSSVGDYSGKESLVVRFFQRQNEQAMRYLLPLTASMRQTLTRRGLHLFVGPTGSGKTTLMYHLARSEPTFQQVITIEDPVEIEEPRFLQLQTNAKINLHYEALIKLCLRHRPDCLLIGEIRDAETAQMVFRASLTGHVVYATLHAKNEVEVYERLQELGLNLASVNHVLQSVLFQRMLPVPCVFCRSEKKRDTSYCPHCVEACLVGNTNFSQQLRKAYAYGYLTEADYYREKD